MRILVAQNIARHRRGGASRLMDLLHRPLADCGHEVAFFGPADVPSVAHGRLGRFAFPWLVRQRAVRAAVTGAPYDIVNVHEPSAAVVATLRARTGGAAVVVMSHGVERRAWELGLEELHQGRAGPGVRSRLLYPLTSLWQSQIGLTRADGVLCVSGEDRDYLVNNMGVPAERITRVYPGADLVFAHAAAGRTYASAAKLLFAGTWRKNKGIEDVVPAFADLARQDANLSMTVLDVSADEASVRAAFPEPLRARVVVRATHTDEETARLFGESDLFVLPSLFEGTPLTLIEAMMSGLPIVTTDTCGMRDIIQDGVNGLLVPVRSPARIVGAVERLRRDRVLRSLLGRTAQGHAMARYTWGRTAATLLQAYERILRVRSAQRP